MATYFQSNPEIQADGLQTLILMNPSFLGYSDSHQNPPQSSNFVLLNSATATAAGAALNPAALPHAPPLHNQHFVNLQLPTSTTTAVSSSPTSASDNITLHAIPRAPMPYTQWSNPIDTSVAARAATRAQQGLSLSLSSQQPGLGHYRADCDGPSPTIGPDGPGSTSSGVSTAGEVVGMQSVMMSSKYLKAAQELLDEVANVGGAIKVELSSKRTDGNTSKTVGETSAAPAADGEGSSGGGESGGKRGGSELTTTERQEIQMKKAKLVTMLEEVEQKYRQYHHQMQIVISSFEQVAGIGSARAYTALALQTISRKFRCLKDAISGQVRAASRCLGEEDLFAGKEGSSRLKFVDHQIRQQRALHQLGMMQHNAWRPQRGLPERSVSVLRAWLFEHFLHPYPKDSDKHMLAKQTGLTRSQVSNWFINARVRLWKPMVEEMYMEEIKDQEQKGSEEKSSRSEQNEDSTSQKATPQGRKSGAENQLTNNMSKQDNLTETNISAASLSTASTSLNGANVRNQSVFTLIGSVNMDGITQNSPKKPRIGELDPTSIPLMEFDVKPSNTNEGTVTMHFSNERQNRDTFSLLGTPANFIGGFGSYPVGEIGRFDTEQFAPRFSGNSVSLSLGLPHCENLSLSGTHQTFLSNQNIQLGRRVDLGEPNEFGAMNSPTNSHSPSPYENISLQSGKRFAAQLLPDFVA
ncbi:Homeobox KN domain [Dillenia turbinata]|uniref:Homeobox KN domain n=1 Tax=Dillenia turbinata TaxID=194707 RepID=A0AAN8W179_9MAGN